MVKKLILVITPLTSFQITIINPNHKKNKSKVNLFKRHKIQFLSTFKIKKTKNRRKGEKKI